MVALLVDWTVLQEIVLGFGVTGHTYSGIDQAFSRFLVSLSLGHLPVADFFERIRNGFTHYVAHSGLLPPVLPQSMVHKPALGRTTYSDFLLLCCPKVGCSILF